MSRWQTLPRPIPYSHEGCVYAIYVDGGLEYIGQTTNLTHRISTHRSPASIWRGKNISVKVSFNRKYGEHAMRELRLIAKLNPPLNKVMGRGEWKPWIKGFSPYTNLPPYKFDWEEAA
jgi:hypothetical protein